MNDIDLSTIIETIQTLGMWAIFAWLYLQERKAHDATRQLWLEDLREIAGLKKSLSQLTQMSDNRPKSDSQRPKEFYPLET